MNGSGPTRAGDESEVEMRWGVKIPLRDGITLNGTLYISRHCSNSCPAIFTLTPYIGQTYHDRAMYFAANGFPFLTIDVRGRGNSQGVFKPTINEAKDGHDVVEWIARQPFCNGKVAMWGGSYAGHDQWNTAKELPPHLATIVPVASPYLGVDFPTRGNISFPYLIQWLTLVSGVTSQEKIFSNNESFWAARFKRWFDSGIAFNKLDTAFGNPSSIFQEWLTHPHQDEYWNLHNPTREQYAQISIPVLTITGAYDGDQLGALQHYREHLKNAPTEARNQHFLIIGPWDHAGTRTPKNEFVGIEVGAASLVDLPKLHLDWYAWTMQNGPRPEFLRDQVSYYVAGAERWRYASSLEGVTARVVPLYLHSSENPTDVFKSGALTDASQKGRGFDFYIYDPREVGHSDLESTVNPESRSDQRMTYAMIGKNLIYHSEPVDAALEVSGFFALSLWLAIDQPDTDFRASIYEVRVDGTCVLLTSDSIRARYRESLSEERLIQTQEPLLYQFKNFTFISRQISQHSRLRLVVGPINSIYSQKNYNSGGIVSEESIRDARTVTVRLFHDRSHESVLYVPIGNDDRDRVGRTQQLGAAPIVSGFAETSN